MAGPKPDETIHRHARDGNLAGVAAELGRGAAVDVRGGWVLARTPLMMAAESPRAGADMVRLLIERGADVNAVTEGEYEAGLSVLSLAAKAGDLEKVSVLLDAGADVRYHSPGPYTVLTHAVHGLAQRSDGAILPIIELLIDRGVEVNTMSKYGESALRSASYFGRFDIVELLLRRGADPSHLRWTPLMHAIAFGSLEDVQAELRRGADLSSIDCAKRTSWLLSLHVGDVDKARALLAAGANRDDRGPVGKGPLTYPIGSNQVEMLEWLLSEGFDPDDPDEFQVTPLMEAAESGHAGCVKRLIDAGADVHRTSHIPQRAIALTNSIPVVRMLVEAGGDLNEISDDMRAVLTRIPNDGRLDVSREDYVASKHRRFGSANPEKMIVPFWRAMITSGLSAYSARTHFGEGQHCGDHAVWCFRRFGKSITELPDGRFIEIAGEHEDHYDPDFCIYNDVVVHHGDGTFDIYGYPKDVFPPTDFHTATLVGPHIFIIGSLGYYGERPYGETQVHRLDVDTLKIETPATTGEKPGWIHGHKAVYDGARDIRITGGKVCVSRDGGEEFQHDSAHEYVLNTSTLEWTRIKSGTP